MTNYREGACHACNQGITDVEPCECSPSPEGVEHPAPPGPPVPPSHVHDDGTVCFFESMHSMRWWSQEKEWPHKPIPCPSSSTPEMPTAERPAEGGVG